MVKTSLDFNTKVDLSMTILSSCGEYTLSMATQYITGDHAVNLVTHNTYELQEALSELISYAYRITISNAHSDDGIEDYVPDYIEQLASLLRILHQEGLINGSKLALVWDNLIQFYNLFSATPMDSSPLIKSLKLYQ